MNWVRTFKDLKHQDWCYDYYKEKSGCFWPLVNLFFIHLMPPIVVLIAMMPAFLLMQSHQPATLLIYMGAGTCVLAVMIQSVADSQMHRFKNSMVMRNIRKHEYVDLVAQSGFEKSGRVTMTDACIRFFI